MCLLKVVRTSGSQKLKGFVEKQQYQCHTTNRQHALISIVLHMLLPFPATSLQEIIIIGSKNNDSIHTQLRSRLLPTTTSMDFYNNAFWIESELQSSIYASKQGGRQGSQRNLIGMR